MGIGYSRDCIDIGTKIHYQLDKRSDTKKDYIITDFKHIKKLIFAVCRTYLGKFVIIIVDWEEKEKAEDGLGQHEKQFFV